jgi:hypothetical protein
MERHRLGFLAKPWIANMRFPSLVLIGWMNVGCGKQTPTPATLSVMSPPAVGDLLAPLLIRFGDEHAQVVSLATDEAERLHRQANGGAPADLFVEEEPPWLDLLAHDGHVAPNQICTIFVDPLVFVTRTNPVRPVYRPDDISPNMVLAVSRTLTEENPAGDSEPLGRLGLGHHPNRLMLAGGDAVIEAVLDRSADVGLVWRTRALASTTSLSTSTALVNPEPGPPHPLATRAVRIGALGQPSLDAQSLQQWLCTAGEVSDHLRTLGLERPSNPTEAPGEEGSREDLPDQGTPVNGPRN